MVGSVSGNLSHPVYARQISAWDRRGLAGPSARTQIPRLTLTLYLFASRLHRLKDLNLQTVPHRLRPIMAIKPKANKDTSRSRHPGCRFTPGGRTAAPIERILVMQPKCGFTTPPLISTYTWDTAMLSYLQCPESNWRSQKGKKKKFSCQNPDTWVRKIYFKRLMKEEKRSACPVVFRSIWSFGPLLFLLFLSPLASAALAGFDHHVGQLLHAGRAAYEVHNGEGLQVLGNAAGSGGGLRVHLVVQGQDLSVQRELTSGLRQHAAFCEEHAQVCSFPQSQVVPESLSLVSRSGKIAPWI